MLTSILKRWKTPQPSCSPSLIDVLKVESWNPGTPEYYDVFSKVTKLLRRPNSVNIGTPAANKLIQEALVKSEISAMLDPETQHETTESFKARFISAITDVAEDVDAVAHIVAYSEERNLGNERVGMKFVGTFEFKCPEAYTAFALKHGFTANKGR